MPNLPRHLFSPLTLMLLLCMGGNALAERLAVEGVDQTVMLSQQDLLKLGPASVTTTTPWTDGESTYRGATLEQVLALAGINGGRVSARALNGYSVNIPVEAAVAAGALVAVSADGELMRVRDKGPFWIVFPWSQQPDLVNREVRAWAIWQLTQISQTP